MTNAFGVVHKRQQRSATERQAAGAVVGGAAAQGVYQGSGYAAKHVMDSTKFRSKMTNRDSKRVNSAKKAAGIPVGQAVRAQDYGRNYVDFFRSYPRDVPGWRARRLMARTHGGKTGTIVGGAVTAAGAVGGVKLAQTTQKKPKRQKIRVTPVKKSFERGEERWAPPWEVSKGLPSSLRRGVDKDALMMIPRDPKRPFDGASRLGDGISYSQSRVMANQLGQRAAKRIKNTRLARKPAAQQEWARQAARDIDEGEAFRNISRGKK